MRYFLVFQLFFCSVLISKAQTQILPADSAIAVFKNLYPQEKVFLQSDKDVYLSGETIWMKAWCALDGAPTYLSRILYVDLMNKEGAVVSKKMYLLDSLSSTGADFDLPQSITTGTYSLNAYTLWMLNFPEYIFRKNLFVYGEDYKSRTGSRKGNTIASFVQFFPEGGDITAGVNNRIAFKATNSNGLPVQVRGQIVDKTGKKVADLVSEHDGMGVADFVYEEGNDYKANIAEINETKGSLSFPLPKAKHEGIALRVENNNPNRLFVLLNRAENRKEDYSVVKVVATINYQVVFSQTLDLSKGESACTINKKNLPAGILHVTLFDKNNLPLAERLTFVENYTLAQPAVILDSKNLKSNATNTISLGLNGVDAPSLSCLLTAFLPGDSANRFTDNIASSFLITSDLKGYIHNPGYYFKDKSASSLHYLDLLLMTQGWRRFEWKKIQHSDFAVLKYPVESAISFRGSVYKSDSKEKVTDGKVSFVIKGVDSTSIIAEAKVTDRGEFLLNNVNYAKSAMVAYMGTNNKKQNYIVDVKLLPNYIDSLKFSGNTPLLNLDTSTTPGGALSKYLANGLAAIDADVRSKTLEAVVIKAKKISPADSLNNAYAAGPFLMGKAINPSEFKHYNTIWQMIQAAVPGVSVEGNPFDPTVSFGRFSAFGTGSSTQSVSESSNGEISQSVVMETGGIAYFLNEVNVTKDIINTLTVDDVALIKVLKNEAAALGASQGAIAIYTKQNVGVGGSIYDKSYTKQKMEGYAIVKQFYQSVSPGDSGAQQNNDNFTLFWNAKLMPAKDGKYRFQFYNNSLTSKLRLLVQGMDRHGQLIFKDMVLE